MPSTDYTQADVTITKIARKYRDRVSNLECESVRIDSKTVLFIRARLSKKEIKVRMGSLVNFSVLVHFSRTGKITKKWACDQKLKLAIAGKISSFLWPLQTRPPGSE